MKRMGILTYFFADNYGAFLQCYALQKFCTRKEYDVQIMNYVPFKMVSAKTRLKRVIRPRKQHAKFNEYRKKYLNIGRVKKYDLILVGSDQVWNPEINNYDNYWIKPHAHYQRIASYAASIGLDTLNYKNRHYFLKNKKSLEKYDVITIRESTGKDIFSSIGIESEITCDPTLLYIDNDSVYSSIIHDSVININAESDILVYSLEHSDMIDQIAIEKKKETGGRLISIHPTNIKTQQNDIFIENSDPGDFLNLIKNCKYIITNSFHGLVFSIIFKQIVFVVFHSTLSCRQKNLLDMCGFDYTYINSNTLMVNGAQRPERLLKLINSSRDRLEKILYEQ